MATVAWAHLNDGVFGGSIFPNASGWTFQVALAYKDTATGNKQVDAVTIQATDAQLNSLAALKQAIANGARDWLVENKGITPVAVIVDEVALVIPN